MAFGFVAFWNARGLLHFGMLVCIVVCCTLECWCASWFVALWNAGVHRGLLHFGMLVVCCTLEC